MKYLLVLVTIMILPGSGNSQGITPEDIFSARKIRISQLNDPIRPCWHLTIAEGTGMPFDPNGAVYKDGVYHLWYLYQGEAGHHWQHLSSIDLFHWRWYSTDLKHHDGDPDEGIFSGNAFIAKDGKVVIAYHGLGTGGNCVAYSNGNDLNTWTKSKANPVAKPGWILICGSKEIHIIRSQEEHPFQQVSPIRRYYILLTAMINR